MESLEFLPTHSWVIFYFFFWPLLLRVYCHKHLQGNSHHTSSLESDFLLQPRLPGTLAIHQSWKHGLDIENPGPAAACPATVKPPPLPLAILEWLAVCLHFHCPSALSPHPHGLLCHDHLFRAAGDSILGCFAVSLTHTFCHLVRDFTLLMRHWQYVPSVWQACLSHRDQGAQEVLEMRNLK